MNSKLLAQVDFENLNKVFSGKATPGSLMANNRLTLGLIISELLKYVFVFAGLALLAYLIMGGYSLMTSGGDPKKVEAGKGKITNAILGFLIMFVAYWVTQIVAKIFGLDATIFSAPFYLPNLRSRF